MRARTIIVRILRAAAITLVALFLLAFTFVQFQQHLLRHRAERLLADFQAIRLNQSTWADAHALITRWGAWGHYDGTCTSADCSYFISLSDQGTPINRYLGDFFERYWPQSYSGLTFMNAYSALGGRRANMQVAFLVQDGIVHRSSITLEVLGWPENADSRGDDLMLRARADDHLQRRDTPDDDEPWIAGDNAQLAQHPEYKVGRPTGCEGCMADWVTFTPYLPLAELRRLTAYNLSCITQRHSCVLLQDLLPAAKEWHLYPYAETPSEPDPIFVQPTSCQIPASALARDAPDIIVVDTISSIKVPAHPNGDFPDKHESQIATVRFVQALKGSSSLTPEDVLKIQPFNGDYDAPLYTAENLVAGKQYVLFIPLPESRGQIKVIPVLDLQQCSVVEDSPELREQILKGIEHEDPLRHPPSMRNPTW